MGSTTTLDDKPVRNPGQSLDEQINEIRETELNDALLLFAMPVAFVFYELWRYYYGANSPLYILVLLGLSISGYGLYKLIKVKKKLKKYKQGRDGERWVGQYLNKLSMLGYRVIHDVVFSSDEKRKSWNIDHILISEKGLYTVETKTLSKPDKGRTEITTDGEKVFKNGNPLFDNPIVQAKAQSAILKKLLKRKTGKHFDVQPIIVFKDWFVKENKTAEVWIHNPKMLRYTLEEQPNKLSKEEVNQVCNILYDYIQED